MLSETLKEGLEYLDYVPPPSDIELVGCCYCRQKPETKWTEKGLVSQCNSHPANWSGPWKRLSELEHAWNFLHEAE